MSLKRNYSNSATPTTLASPITAGSTAMTVGSVSGYPSVPFSLAIESEAILVEEVAGLTLKSLTRGFDGTIATAHSTSVTVEHRALADDFSWRYESFLLDSNTGVVGGDEFDDEDGSAWTQVTPTGTADWVRQYGKLSVVFAGQASNDVAGNVMELGLLSPPLYVCMAFQAIYYTENYFMVGPLFSDGTSTSSNVIWFMPYATVSLRQGTFANVSTTLDQPGSVYAATGLRWLRLDWLATNTWRFWGSSDGISWVTLGGSQVNGTLTPTHFGIGVSSWGGTSTWFRQASIEAFRAYDTKPSFWQEH